jgi:hypothetical protein
VSLYRFGKAAFGPWEVTRYFLVLFGISLVTGFIFNTAGFLMYKQIIGICYTGIAYWAVFLFSKGNVGYLTKSYLNIAFLEALFGLTGEVLHILGLSSFGTYSENSNLIGAAKISGTTSEPYFFALSLVPAAYVYLNDLVSLKSVAGVRYSKVKGAVTILAFILAGASSGYLAIFIMLLFLAYNKNVLNFRSLGLLLMPVLVYFALFLFNLFASKSKGFSDRINHTFYAFVSDESESVKAGKINGSSFSLYSNYKVAMSSFQANPISGSGLGTHQLNYEKYFYQTFSAASVKRFVYELNKQDANSTFLRLISETGLVGLLAFLFFIGKNLTLRKRLQLKGDNIKFLLLFNQGIFIMMVIRLLRTGNYIGNGFFFFFFAYWAIHQYVESQSPESKSRNKEALVAYQV